MHLNRSVFSHLTFDFDFVDVLGVRSIAPLEVLELGVLDRTQIRRGDEPRPCVLRSCTWLEHFTGSCRVVRGVLHSELHTAAGEPLHVHTDSGESHGT